jgi:arsenical pump membrane protein
MSSVVNRILIGAAGLPVVLGALWAGGWWLFALVAIAGTIAVHEFVTMARPLAPLAPAAYSGTLLALLGAAALAALLANLLNNLPALLVLLPGAAAAGPATVLAVLIGVNAGPNLTYTGSLATLLWRRELREREAEPPLGEFLRLGALTVPAILAAATFALWLVA